MSWLAEALFVELWIARTSRAMTGRDCFARNDGLLTGFRVKPGMTKKGPRNDGLFEFGFYGGLEDRSNFGHVSDFELVVV